MADYAHNETDKRIAELEKRLSKEYKQAYKETKDKLEKYLSDFKRKDEKKRQEVENGTLSEKDYKTWRRNQMLTGQRWTDMVDTLAKDMNNVNVIAAQIVSGEIPEAFLLNANYSAYEIENGYRQNYGFTLYDRDTVDRLVSENPDLLPEPSVDIPADLRWNKQKIVSNITQAVLQGKSIPEIAKSMETIVGMNKASAVRNARTAMTGAQNAGRQQAYERAEAMGIKLQKEWIATLDSRTRHSHGMADGQKVDINGMFSVGGCKMRYPGDVQNGTAAEIYNCRCTMCTVEPPEIMQGEEPRMTYSEWVKTKEGQEATGGKFAEKPLDNDGEKSIVKIEDCSDFKQLAEHLSGAYGIELSPSVTALNFTACREALKGVESVISEFPELGNYIQKITTDSNGVMSCNGKTIAFNPKYFAGEDALNKLQETCRVQSGRGFWPKNSVVASIGAHEAGHGVEWILDDTNPNYSFDFQKIIAWDKCTEAKTIVSKAIKNVKSTPYGKGKKKIDLQNAISGYAARTDSETMAEAFADVYINGKDANPLSVEIKKLTIEKLKKYKGVL